MDILLGLNKIKFQTSKAAGGALRGCIAGGMVGSVLGLFGTLFIVNNEDENVPITYIKGGTSIELSNIILLNDLMNIHDIGIIFKYRSRNESAWNEAAFYIQKIINMYKLFLDSDGKSSAADVAKLISSSIRCTKALSKLHLNIRAESKIMAEKFQTASMNFHLCTEEIINIFRNSDKYEPVIIKK
jgi:hypothetical protein